MDKMLQEKLGSEFPFMRRDINGADNTPINNIYQKWGCECSNGWYHLIWNLCSEITEAYKEANLEIDLVVKQVKEKWGALRFYYSYKGVNHTCHAIDGPSGGVRLYPDHPNNELHKKIADIVRKYEEKSLSVCEICGAPGELRTDLRWIRTLCDDCYQKFKKKEMLP